MERNGVMERIEAEHIESTTMWTARATRIESRVERIEPRAGCIEFKSIMVDT